MPKIRKAKIFNLATDGFEQSELEVPLEKLREAAQLVHVAASKSRKSMEALKGWKDGNCGSDVKVDIELPDASPSFYDAIVLPGGMINPDKLRVDKESKELVGDFVEGGNVIATICHAPWLLIEANVIRG